MDFLAALTLILFGIPIVTGHVAKQYGRSFWAWFGIACVLPGIAFFILAMLPDLTEQKNTENKITGS